MQGKIVGVAGVVFTVEGKDDIGCGSVDRTGDQEGEEESLVVVMKMQ